MKNRYYLIVALLIGGHLLTELHTFIYWLWPDSEYYFVDHWFIKKGFTVTNVNILWYSKMIEDLLLGAALLIAGASQAFTINYASYLQWQRYSMRLYVIWCIYFVYHIFDLISFLYNYKTTYWLYVMMLIICSVAALFAAFRKIEE